MIKVDLSPDIFISTLTEKQVDMAYLDSEISKIMANEPRVLWQGKFWGGSEQSIIGYGDLNYVRPKKAVVEWFKIGLAAQKNYISIYVNAVEDKQYLTEKYADKLGKVKVGKSSITFKKVEDINLENFIELIRKAKQLMSNH
ncbi:DUF1801 domain-containing protein [Algoriphagus sp. D3-2-R+10]|uniref:DUF1801 domain-containing protein n=1 Tax=Algoriphagus aurantiacus TaxID=3103948 RepID=UPI002B3C5F5B|nr:DUF1801 domain-containing protein [Algoriphagus sp. D3-2-R+10]MEB2776404.1 DUF1801 domain-containing protein [Algoriphagus sp. D3-2-R+10]